MPPEEVLPEWRRFVDRALEALTRDYLSPGGLLLHGSWGGLWGRAGESIMPYGNYFLIKALYRLLRPDDDLLER
jgi:unsaturated chondroitin disaccharide hydrolase